MAFDGITIAGITAELDSALSGGRINKIAQPEADELLITIKNNKTQYRLLLSASASLPLLYLTSENKPSPLTAPNFCMLLRKHIGSGRILSVRQPGLERVVEFEIEHLNELGDICRKRLIVEIMGKHSNIIFCTPEGTILDSIKHVSAHMSSVREVLPGRQYFIPQTQDKIDPLSVTQEDFEQCLQKPLPLAKALYTSFTGFSPVMAEELCYRASLDGGASTASLDEPSKLHLYRMFTLLMDDVREKNFHPNIVYDGVIPREFAAVPLLRWADEKSVAFESISRLLEQYYAEKNKVTRIRQKSSELRRVVQTALERNVKKLALQTKQMKDTQKKEKYRVYGELLNTYGYQCEPEAKSMEALNYYTSEMITIPLDPLLSAQENAKKYFDRYGKLKRTAAALSELMQETQSDIEHLESISTALDLAQGEEDLAQIREELAEYGYMKRRFQKGGKKPKITSHPLHYISSDGFDIYVGKNNYQNEEISFKLASGNDWWFHAKGQPGSHVIVKSGGKELPDRTFEEAGRLAGYYSKGRQAPKVEIDYTQKKNLKKPTGGKPGFVVYYTNYSLLIEPDISNIKQIS